MKKLIGLMAVGALSVSTMSGVALAAPRQEDSKASAALQRAVELRNSLKPAQRDALVRASQNWGIYTDSEKFIAQVERDVNRIMSPAQADRFMDLVSPQVNAGGMYLKLMCVSNSLLGMTFSLVGVIGCGNETATIAFIDSYAAFTFANYCLLTGASSCEQAVAASGASAAGWYSMIESCDVADTAYYSTAATYATCGGTWE